MNRPLRLTECSPRISWADVALLTIRSQRFGNPFAALWQTTSSRRGPIYRARIYVFATTLHTIWNAFTERPQRVHSLYVIYSLCKSMVFAPQKYGFCATKVWFLACKNPLFTLQKPPFWNARNQTTNTEQRSVVLYIRCTAIAFWCWIWWKQGAAALWFGVHFGF